MSCKRLIAIDLGASSGRAVSGGFDGKTFTMEELHRFSNDPVECSGGFFWDTLRLVHEIKLSLEKAKHTGGADSAGIDTWGVDYGYIDRAGALLSNPYHYRDLRTLPMMERVYSEIPYGELYSITGIESMSFNTVFQIASDITLRPWLIECADKMLLMPDLLGYMLCKNCESEYTIASTTALIDAETKSFSKEVLGRLSIPERLFAPVVMPGGVKGKTSDGVSIVNVASHDTASAILAVPAANDSFLYISSGTWSLMGIESASPVINDRSLEYSFTNEGGALGKINVMKNIMGLWLLQESRRQWRREGAEYTFDELSDMASSAKPLQYIINPDDASFSPAGDMPSRIRDYCERTGQGRPESAGEIVRCIFESLALRYRATAEMLESLTGRTYNTINIVGGGVREELLSRFTADCTGRQVIAGPVEATALGNIAMQAIAMGEIASPAQAREIIRNSFGVKTYESSSADGSWDEAFGKFIEMTKKG